MTELQVCVLNGEKAEVDFRAANEGQWLLYRPGIGKGLQGMENSCIGSLVYPLRESVHLSISASDCVVLDYQKNRTVLDGICRKRLDRKCVYCCDGLDKFADVCLTDKYTCSGRLPTSLS